MKGIEIKAIIYGTSEYERSIDLRNEVFRKPWGLNIRDEDRKSTRLNSSH